MQSANKDQHSLLKMTKLLVPDYKHTCTKENDTNNEYASTGYVINTTNEL